jgi:hypothetical protein
MSKTELSMENEVDPMPFKADATKDRLSGLQVELDLLLLLLEVLECACASARADAGPLTQAKRAVARARTELLGLGEDVQRALSLCIAVHNSSYPARSFEFTEGQDGDPVMPALEATRERMDGMHAELDMLLALLNAGRRGLANAECAIRKARGQLAEAQLQMDRALTVERGPGGANEARRAS